MAEASSFRLSVWEQQLEQQQKDQDRDEESSGSEFEFDHTNVSSEDATERFAQYVIELKDKGYLSATQACVLCHWAAKAGLGGTVAQLAMPPLPVRATKEERQKLQTGAFSRKYDTVTGIMEDAGDYYFMNVVCAHRSEGVRGTRNLPVWPPLEALAEEIVGNATLADDLRIRIKERRLPPNYFDHVVFRGAPDGELVYPVALYIDGTNFNRVDGALGIWLYNLVTQSRSLLVALRKADLCACGCRGWDTLLPIMTMLDWSFKAMAQGRRPEYRHDGTDWRDTEQERAQLSGERLGWRAAVMSIKNDMMEFVTSFGFPSWGDASNPCPCCWCTKGNIDSIAGISPLTLPWQEKR